MASAIAVQHQPTCLTRITLHRIPFLYALHPGGQMILDELKLVLEEDAAVFMTKMWRMLVFCTLRTQERAAAQS